MSVPGKLSLTHLSTHLQQRLCRGRTRPLRTTTRREIYIDMICLPHDPSQRIGELIERPRIIRPEYAHDILRSCACTIPLSSRGR